jgi:pimeloyl-ACP methyl ester carboxylesterase
MKLFYRHFGSGDPVIILHGVFGMSDNWVTLGRRLGEHFSVFIPDQRNHGHSPHSQIHNYYALVDDMLEFIDEHGLKNPVIIGHSMGGKVAMGVALEVPLLLRTLIIIDISPGSYPVRQEHMDILRAMGSIDPGTLTSRQAVDAELNRYHLSEKIRYFVLKNLHRDSSDRFSWRINLDALEKNLELVSGSIPFKGTYTGPVLVICGGDSDYVTEADRPIFMSYFPNVQFARIPGASHWIQADRPDELFRELTAFLKLTQGRVSTG